MLQTQTKNLYFMHTFCCYLLGFLPWTGCTTSIFKILILNWTTFVSDCLPYSFEGILIKTFLSSCASLFMMVIKITWKLYSGYKWKESKWGNSVNNKSNHIQHPVYFQKKVSMINIFIHMLFQAFAHFTCAYFWMHCCLIFIYHYKYAWLYYFLTICINFKSFCTLHTLFCHNINNFLFQAKSEWSGFFVFSYKHYEIILIIFF